MRQPTVLLVDVFRDECEMYAEYLESRGFAVTVWLGPGSALEMAKATGPDVVVTRIRQPKPQLDGIELTAAIKNDPVMRRMAVVVITTSILSQDEEAARAAGCDSYMVLPKTPDELANQILAILSVES